MTNKQYDDCQIIIHSAAVAAGAAGALPVPGSDAVVIVAAQTGMIIALGKVFGVKMTKSAAEAMALTVVAKNAGRLIAGGLMKFVPFAGSFFGGCVNGSVAFSITEALGWEVAESFSTQSK